MLSVIRMCGRDSFSETESAEVMKSKQAINNGQHHPASVEYVRATNDDSRMTIYRCSAMWPEDGPAELLHVKRNVQSLFQQAV